MNRSSPSAFLAALHRHLHVALDRAMPSFDPQARLILGGRELAAWIAVSALLVANGFASASLDSNSSASIPALSKGMLVVDVYDANSKKIVWRGVATGTGSDGPTKNADRIEKALADLFKQLPLGLELPK